MRRPYWAILSPVPPAVLAPFAGTVETGTGAYNALVGYEPGSEGWGEDDLAQKLSIDHPGVHYVLYFDDEPMVLAFEQGKFGSGGGSPEELARQLGCPLVPERKRSLDAALIVVGKTPEQTAVAWGISTEPENPVRLESAPLGTLAWSTTLNVVRSAGKLSALLGTTIYAVLRNRASGLFRCAIWESGTERGVFEEPRTGAASVTSVLGESTPEGIQRALGVRWGDPIR